MQMSISSPWQGKNHLRSLGEHVRKQSLIASHPRKKGEHSNKLPRHKTLVLSRTHPEKKFCKHFPELALRIVIDPHPPLFFSSHSRPLLIEQTGQEPESTQAQSSRLPYLPLQTPASPPRQCFYSAIHAGAILSPNSPAANYKSTYPPR